MTMIVIEYFVQALENGIPKTVSKEYGSLIDAMNFLDDCRKNNPEAQFRLVTCKEEYSMGHWNDPR